MTETLKEQLIRHEDLRCKPYKDSVGKLTIGVGHNLDDKGISPRIAMLILDEDIQEATMLLEKNLPWTSSLDAARKNVLINMTFNMGIAGLLTFKNTLSLIQAKRYDEAAENMLKSKWATQVGIRAVELARIMKDGN
jgi:lysozyme